jgi:hypothetical protein
MVLTRARSVKLLAAGLLGALLALWLPAFAFSQRAVPPFRISAVKAMLYYGQTGSFSADLFGPAAPTLQNVRTGEGQSTATLVVIEITGRPDAYAPTRQVSLTATAGQRALLTKTLAIGRPAEDGKFHAAFWLYDTGCAPVVLKARLLGQTEDSAIQKTINFKCGD